MWAARIWRGRGRQSLRPFCHLSPANLIHYYHYCCYYYCCYYCYYFYYGCYYCYQNCFYFSVLPT